MLGKALNEWPNLQSLLNTVINFFDSPYIWGDFYRIVVMPPAYPMAQMANPLLCYASPTTIVGDGSSETTIAKGMAQLWTGAQVTNSNWQDSWLVLGLSTYAERMVAASWENLYDVYTEAYYQNNSMTRQA
jgi:leukotriene-A4 hydrolase